MPELPEVETVRLGLEPFMTGKTVRKITTHREGLRVPFPEGLAALQGRRIDKLTRRAKYLLVHLGADILVIHLGMSGRITAMADLRNHKRAKHDHFILDLEGHGGIVFNDPRRFGLVLMLAEKDMAQHEAFKSLGPEPLSHEFTGKVLHARLKGKKVPIKTALLDQRVVAGIGNIYDCEALFAAQIAPQRLAGDLSGKECDVLVKCIKNVLTKAIKAGGSSLKDYRKTDGELGYFQYGFKVYDREGEACPRCASQIKKAPLIQRITQGGRSTFFCARCQK